jgi:hypothetical protein
MAELLLGGPRTGRDHTVKDPDPGKAFPGGEIYLSFPAWVTVSQLGSPVRSANTSPGSTPRTRCSATPAGPRSPAVPGKATSSSPVGWRITGISATPPTNGRSAASPEAGGPASSTTRRSPPAGAITPPRALGNRWLEILWHCLTKGVLYDENIHVANRNRALGHAA